MRRIITVILFLSSLYAVGQKNSTIIFNEIHYNPQSAVTATDVFASDSLEFIELKNISDAAYDISSAFFGDGITYTFDDGVSIEAGGYIVLANNAEAYKHRYGNDPDGEFNGKLSNKGELLSLLKGTDTISKVEYNDNYPWPIIADGYGYSLSYTGNEGDIEMYTVWGASVVLHGTPGEDNDTKDILPVLVNEVYPNSDGEEVDKIELYNPNNEQVNISGWFLTDNTDEPKKWVLPQGTVIAANSYRVIKEGMYKDGGFVTESDHFGSAFSLSSLGDEVYLFSAENGELTGFTDGFKFDETESGVSVGRLVTSEDKIYYSYLQENSFGAANGKPAVGPLAFEQIMYNPVKSGPEFIKVKNISDEAVDMLVDEATGDYWTVKGFNVDRQSLADVVVPAGASLYFVFGSPEKFREINNVPDTEIVVEVAGGLSKDGEEIEIRRPGVFDTDTGTEIHHITSDIVEYNDKGEWPELANGGAAYLLRSDFTIYGSDPVAWESELQGYPVADAGKDSLVAVDVPFTLNGNASFDPNGAAIESYSWKLITKPISSAVVLDDDASVTATFTPDVLGDYVFQLTVTTADGESYPNYVEITASPDVAATTIKGLSVYPTYFENLIVVKTEEACEISVCNINGIIVYNAEVIGEEKIKTGDLPKGVYFLSVKTESGASGTYQLVK